MKKVKNAVDPKPDLFKGRGQYSFKKGELQITVICAFCRKRVDTGWQTMGYSFGVEFLIPSSWSEARGDLWCGECDPRCS